MNSTITSVNDNTMNLKVREYTKFLIANKGKVFRAVFTKQDGTDRTMTFTINTNWNPLNGFATTRTGKKMIGTKVSRNMATVTEKVGFEGESVCLRPRTLNLATIKSLVLA